MKIDNADKCQPLNPQQINQSGSGDCRPDFAQVLQQTVRQSSSGNVIPNSTAQSVRPTDIASPPEQVVLAVNQTGEILDTLNRYQQLLSSLETTLRQIQPVVEQLGNEALKMETSMNQLPKGHAVKAIMEETLIQVNQEIERFNQGVYVS
jgi:exonuclease VII small subunit